MFKMTKKKIYIEKEKRKKEKHFSNIFKVIGDIFIPHKQPEYVLPSMHLELLSLTAYVDDLIILNEATRCLSTFLTATTGHLKADITL